MFYCLDLTFLHIQKLGLVNLRLSYLTYPFLIGFSYLKHNSVLILLLILASSYLSRSALLPPIYTLL